MRAPPRSTLLRVGALLLAAMALGGSSLLAQTGTITGRVTDAQSGQPIASAQVFIADQQLGALTQSNGRFLLVNVPPGTYTVSVTRIGYRAESREVTVGAGETVVSDFTVTQEALQLNEVVVTGTAGGSQRRALGNAVTTVSAADVVAQGPLNNVQDLLSGRSPGLDFGRLQGNVGTGSPMQIRGVSSLSLDQQPLIYVDGVRINNDTEAGPMVSSGNREAVINVFQDFSPDEIESIEVIKGPAAATLYGTEASAGVIQIITKKGAVGAPRWHLSTSRGANYLPDPSGKIGTQWGIDSGGNLIEGFDGYPNVYDYEKNVNGNDPLQTGVTQNYLLDVNGGTDQIRYFLSGRWQNDEGIVSYNYDKKLNLRGNIDVVFGESLSLGVSTSFVSGKTSLAQQLSEPGGIWDAIYWAQPELKDTDRRGFLRYTPEELETVSATREYERFTGSATLTHQLGDAFTQRLVVGLDRGNDENQVLVPRHPLGTASAFGGIGLGDVRLDRPRTHEWTLDYGASLEYGVIGAVTATSSAGAQFYSSEINRVETSGSVLASPALRSIEGATRVDVGQTFIQNKSFGVYFQQEMNWRDRVFLTGALRADDNSAFGAASDPAIYPKVSAAWVVSEESFWESVPVVSQLRLRSALGQAGRQPNTFDAVTLYAPRTGRGGEPAVVPSTRGNPEVGPEVGTELEVGFDYGLLDGRIAGDFTYFHQWTTNALVSLPLLPSEGFSGTEAQNLGQINNWGWELSVNSTIANKESWGLDLGLSATHTMNEIIDLGGRPPDVNLKEGLPYPINTSSVIVSAEFDSGGNPVNVMCDSGTGKLGIERGGPAVPCAETAGYELLLGPAFPPYTFSIAPTLSLFDRTLQIFAQAEGQHGHWVGSTNTWCRFAGCFTNARVSLALDDPIYVEGQVFQQRHPRDDTLVREFDASFWKLRRIGARYQLPEAWVGRIGADRASISVSGTNIWTIWQKTKSMYDVPIVDPEWTGARSGNLLDSDLGRMPPLSSVSARIDVTF